MNVSESEMTCQELVELVTQYFDGTLPPSERTRFEAHLGECPYCQRYLEQMRQTVRLLGRLSENDISPEVRDELLRRFRHWKRDD